MKDIVRIFDPTIDLSLDGNLSIEDVEYGSGDKQLAEPYKYSQFVGNYSPAVDINGLLFNGDAIISSELNVFGFLPTITVTIREQGGMFASQHYPTDGDVIKLYIKSSNTDFKPVRQNYRILSVEPTLSDKDGLKNMYTIFGVLDLPEITTDRIKAFPDMFSIDVLMEIAKELGLGFATNETETDDKMTWICPNTSYMDFIQNDVVSAAYKNDESFFTVYIDEHYYLTLVEVNTLLVHELDLPVETINYLSQTSYFPDDNDEAEKYENEFFLSNSKITASTPNQITAYAPINNSGNEFMDNGYRTYIQYYDKSIEDYADQFLETLTSPDTNDNMIIQKGKEREDHTTMLRSVYAGDQFNDNVHANYYFAKLQNSYNMSELKKLSLKIDIASINPNIYRYKICPVIIISVQSDYLKEEVMEEDNEELAVDRFFSGYYLARGIKHVYGNGRYYSQLLASKREYDKSRYKLTKSEESKPE